MQHMILEHSVWLHRSSIDWFIVVDYSTVAANMQFDFISIRCNKNEEFTLNSTKSNSFTALSKHSSTRHHKSHKKRSFSGEHLMSFLSLSNMPLRVLSSLCSFDICLLRFMFMNAGCPVTTITCFEFFSRNSMFSEFCFKYLYLFCIISHHLHNNF